MISIIICYNNQKFLNRITKNIEETIGVTYELVIINNSSKQYSIFSAYNEGVQRSKFNILCFCHQDIIYYTNNWGNKVIEHFKDDTAGMIGVAGGLALPVSPAAWWYNTYYAKEATSILMPSKKSDKNFLYWYNNNPFKHNPKTEVIIIDGLWFCIKKQLFKNISFDENNFDGFHMYDADISMQVLNYAKNYVVFDILLLHDWHGDISQGYYFDLIKFTNKWHSKLPIQINGFSKKYVHILGWTSLRNFILDMKYKKIEKKYIEGIKNFYYPLLKKNYNSLWFRLYFLLSSYIGYKLANSLFFRLEILTGFAKNPGHSTYKYAKNNLNL